MATKYSRKKIQELTSSYALGALEDRETELFKRLLGEDPSSSEKELKGFEEVVELLGFSAPSVTPPSGLKDRLLRRIREKAITKEKVKEREGFLYVRSQEGEWKDIAEGVSLKPLFYDPIRQYATALVRMSAKTHFPNHRHTEAEECYVIEGAIEMGGQLFRKGDYIRAEAGSIHEGIYSESGCTLLILSSQRNEVLE
jgi:anti-sigma factor ChrR (cupin superfamily)